MATNTEPGFGDSQPGPPHEALFFVLPYLPVLELLAVRRVCRALKDGADLDESVWMRITVDRPLNSRLSDDLLLNISSRSAANLRAVALVGCRHITDDGLRRLVRQNPRITELYLTGCSGLTPEGVTGGARALTGLKAVGISGIHGFNKHHIESLRSCLLPQTRHPPLPHHHRYTKPAPVGVRPIDVEVCPRCHEVRMVFECPRESCWREGPSAPCLGCYFCVPRCEECGGCVEPEPEPEEAACGGVVCMDCWFRLPKCSFCNKPFCRRHAGSVCGACAMQNSSTNDQY